MGKFQNKRFLQTLRSKIRKRMVSTLLGLKNNEENIQNEKENLNKNSQISKKELIEDPEEIDLEKLLLEKANRIKNPENEPVLSLIHDTHLLTFQQTTDLFTLLYTSIIFKWIKSERVRTF